MGTHQNKVNKFIKNCVIQLNKKVWETVHFQSFFKKLALRMDGLFICAKAK